MKIAMIGAGGIARRHLRVLAAEPEIEIVGIVSPTAANAAATARLFGGRAYADHEELLRHEQVDAAWICVPPGSHGAIETSLLARGIPFFIEKPLAADRATAEEIARAITVEGVIAGVGYHWRALDTMPEVRQVLAGHPARMVLGAWHDATPPPRWWRYQATGGGQMVEQATHLFDLARSLVGEAHVTAATATRYGQAAYPDADVADVSAALLQYEHGATGVFTATALLGGLSAAQVQLVCEGIMITITQQSVIYERGREKRQVFTGNDPFVVEDRAFLAAVADHDPARLISSYADALLTHRLCCDVLDKSTNE